MSSLLILGAGGHANVVLETALCAESFSSFAFLDDRHTQSDTPSTFHGWPILGVFNKALDPLFSQRWSSVIVAIGDPYKRLSWLQRLREVGYEVPVLIHPTAWVSPSAVLGAGTVIFAHSSVQSNAAVGSGVILNTGCSVDHDAVLGDCVHICPGAHLAGQVRVGSSSWIGIGSSVIQQITIGEGVTVGAGAAVIDDLPDFVTAVGVPARILERE